MWLKITQNYSPNFSTPKRLKKNINYIIIHYTGMKNELSALDRLTNYKSKVSAHYFVKKNGKILNISASSGYLAKDLSKIVGDKGKIIATDVSYSDLKPKSLAIDSQNFFSFSITNNFNWLSQLTLFLTEG